MGILTGLLHHLRFLVPHPEEGAPIEVVGIFSIKDRFLFLCLYLRVFKHLEGFIVWVWLPEVHKRGRQYEAVREALLDHQGRHHLKSIVLVMGPQVILCGNVLFRIGRIPSQFFRPDYIPGATN